MSRNRSNAKAIFLQAIEEHEPDQRLRFVDAACGSDMELRRRVEALLRAHGKANPLLDADGPVATLDLPPIGEQPGDSVGPYRLLEQIGEGGFGVVFLAEQTAPVRRRVALKVLKPGMDTRQVVARFEVERQALAMMDHPNIAKVFDAGATVSGRPYFVMELVQGVPITEYCDHCQLTTRERLELFVTVCEAVQHAHHKGVIHRDLKPTNVLVALQDGRPAPRVIDFGIAKAAGQRLTEETLRSGFAQMVGTPLYMSPEQAELSPLGVDTRSDIYALGVLLYELMTGTTPFDRDRMHGAAYEELRRIIRDEEPPLPSARISTLAAAMVTTVAAQRRTEPRRLRQTVRGDLDWIVMKCLDKDRNRRYETAGGVAADVRRYLRNEPVEARSPSAVYRFRKFLRRHKGGVAMAAGVAALALCTLVVAWQRDEARTHRLRADEMARTIHERLYATDMRLAHQAWLNADVPQVLDLLERYRPREGERDVRGFEWHYLWRLCHSERLTLRGHTGEVYFVTFSPDGTRLATASGDRTVRLWNSATGELLATLVGHTGEVTGVSFSPDGQMIASAGDDRTVRLWDPSTGRELAVLRGHADTVFNAVFSPDGRLLMSGGSDGTVKLWDPITAEEVASWEAHGDDVEHLALSPDGRLLATAGGEQHSAPSVKLWDVAARELQATLLGHQADVLFVAFSPDGRTLASGSSDHSIKLWDVASGTEQATWHARNDEVHGLAFLPEGGTLASAHRDGTVRLWDVSSGGTHAVMRGHLGRVWSVAASSDGRTMATAGADQTVKLWDTDQLGHRIRLAIAARGRAPGSLSPDGKWLVTWDENPKQRETVLRIWDAQSAALRSSSQVNTQLGFWAAVSPDSKLVAMGHQQHARLIDLQSQHLRGEYAIPQDTLCGAVSHNGRWLASSYYKFYGDNVRVHDTAGKRHLTLRGHAAPAQALAFSPDDRTLASGGNDAVVHLWDPAKGKLRATLKGHRGEVHCVAFDRSGTVLASAGNDGTVRLWDATTHQHRANLLGHTRAVRWAAFSPDGRTLATASEDHTVRLWHVATGQELLVLDGHTGPVTYAAFYPDGRRLLTIAAGADGRGEFFVWSAAEDAAPRGP